MYTIHKQWTHIQQNSEAVMVWDSYSYRNTRATKPLLPKQKAARVMYTIDTLLTQGQQHSEEVMAWNRYSYRNTSATKPLIT